MPCMQTAQEVMSHAQVPCDTVTTHAKLLSRLNSCAVHG
jgi:hypothetical protein